MTRSGRGVCVRSPSAAAAFLCAALAPLAFAAPGCSRETRLHVEVEGPSLAGVLLDALDVTIDAASGSAAFQITERNGSSIELPTAFGVILGGAEAGPITVCVTAVAGGLGLESGCASGTVVVGETTELTIVLGTLADGGVDGGPPGDGGPCVLDEPCDDADACTLGETCNALGACTGGAPTDCSAFADQCNVAACDPATGCRSEPTNDGVTCDDAQFCTLADACQTGVCTGAMPNLCSDLESCTTDSCDEANDACTGTPLPDGTACLAGGGCLMDGMCAGGVCGAMVPAPPGTVCDDGSACTMTDVCDAAGGCAGQPVLCDDSNVCTANGCNPLSGCTFPPQPSGTVCDDGLFCTEIDTCATGACGGLARDCDSFADACNSASCVEAAGACVQAPLSDGTICDDGLFCTTPDACTAGVCSGLQNDCPSETDQCNVGVCSEAMDDCVPVALPDGTVCDDGAYCLDGDVCTGGLCAGAPRDCGSGASCISGSCDEVMNMCVGTYAGDGTPCDDGLDCTGGDACSMTGCAGTPVSCPPDTWACTTEACDEAAGGCASTRDELACAPVQVCNPVAYAGVPSGCGPAPDTFIPTTCPSGGPVGMSTCSFMLSAGPGVPGEATNITCTVRPRPVTLFFDDFTDGVVTDTWALVSGTPLTISLGGNVAAYTSMAMGSWEADTPLLNVAGLAVLCVDYDMAQREANTAESFAWEVSLDGAAFVPVYALDFAGWEVSAFTHLYNRNVCVNMLGGATTAAWRLRMNSGTDTDAIWIDDVRVTGIAAPWTTLASDDFMTTTAWTFVGGSAPYTGSQGTTDPSLVASSTETFTATRAPLDATICDVLDVDYDFGFGLPDSGEDIKLEVSAAGSPWTIVADLGFDATTIFPDSIRLPWYGLHRLSDILPAAGGAPAVSLRFTLASTGSASDYVLVDNLTVRCADLAPPALGSVVDAGGGTYSVTITTMARQDVDLTCSWQTSNDGPLAFTRTITFGP